VFESLVYARDPNYYERIRDKNSFLLHVGVSHMNLVQTATCLSVELFEHIDWEYI